MPGGCAFQALRRRRGEHPSPVARGMVGGGKANGRIRGERGTGGRWTAPISGKKE